MDRSNKPSAIGVSASLPQPTISLRDNTVEATLPTGESVTVHLYGATVSSWKLANGQEQLFLSEKAHLDGSKPIRGGIPVVFPAFGPPPKDHATSSLPQHGFARNSNWEFLGKSSSESLGKDRKDGDDAVKLDFGLSHGMLSDEFRKAWPYEFGLVYSVTLTKDGLGTSLQVQNKGSQNFDFQVLMHTYLKIDVFWLCHFNLSQNQTNYNHRTSRKSASRTSSPRRMSTRFATPVPSPKSPPHYPSPKRRTASTKL
ncbi:hypothetical protein AWENTII_004279 [Aspergillus wentii]